MGRLFTSINVLFFIIGTIASRLRGVISSYYLFSNKQSLKNIKYSQGLEDKKGAGRSFSHRPESSDIVPTYKSSVLLCYMGECGCLVCEFLQGNTETTTLIRVIEVLDTKLAESEKSERNLLSIISNG